MSSYCEVVCGTKVPKSILLISLFFLISATSLSAQVLNGSFETGSPDNWNKDNDHIHSTVTASDGTRSLEITGSGGMGSTSQTISLNANTDYNISVWVQNAGHTAGIAVFDTTDVFDGAGQGQFVIDPGEANTWTLFSGSFNSGAVTSITLRMFTNGTFNGTVYFDNVKVEEPETAIVGNGSFENGNPNPDSWNKDNDHSISTVTASDGSQSLLITGSGSLGNTTQTISLNTNTDYDISVWVQAAGLTAGSAIFDTQDVFDGPGQGQFVIDPGEADVWTEFSGSFNSGATTSINLRMFTNGTFNGTVYFDSIQVVESVSYTLTVNSGTGDGDYSSGEVVNITADAPPGGQVFDGWVINTGSPVIADANASTTTLTMPAEAATITATYAAADVTAPTPNPMTFTNGPEIASSSSITMTATTATDPSGVEYYFTNTAGGGNDSGWQDSATYVDSGLTAGITYSYTVTARDKSAGQNAGTASSAASVLLNAATNVVQNGSFENGGATPDSWGFDVDHTYATANGNYGVRSHSISGSGGLGNTTQVVTLTANTDYNISVWVEASGLTAGHTVFDTSDVFDGSGQGQFVIDPGEADVWTEFTGSFNSGAVTSITIRMFTNAAFSGTVYWDDISITEATTYALTVNSGTGDGNYASGNVVNITADAPSPGDVFDTWVINSGSPVITDVNASSTTLTMPAGAATITATYTTAPDTTAPTPDPMTFASAPAAVDTTSITMTATTATDPSGVEYYFTNTAGGGNDSGWQDSATYIDTGLTPNTSYSYTVTARDKSAAQNATAASSAESATTDPILYALTVNSGTGDGNYQAAQVVNITADAPAPGDVFDAWVINSGSPVIANANSSTTTLTMPAGAAEITATYSTPDTTAPTPDPMTISSGPTRVDATSITMTASTASDPSGVEYYFTNTAGGGNDSGWQDSATYVDTGLTAGNTYSYTVTSRDKSAAQNATSASSAASLLLTSANNIVQNGSFENGGSTPDSWGFDVDHTYATGNGNYGVRSHSISGSGGLGNTTQVVTLTPNTNYDISVWVEASGLTAGHTVFDTSDIFDGAGQGQFVIDPGEADVWTQFTGSFNSGAETSITIRMFTNAAFNGTVYWDDISIVESSLYTLTVNSGTGDGDYASGNVVNISADTPPAGQVFDAWVTNLGTPVITDVNAASTTLTMPAEAATITATYVDLVAPTPDPMTFASAPAASGTTSITMTATTASDINGVEYYFTNTAGGGNDSGWQDSATYVDTGLTPNTSYSYTVTARDKSAAQNSTAASSAQSATTDPILYALTVNSGSGDGSYQAAQVVNITADAAPAGQAFNGWVINTGTPVIADANASITTLTMPAGAASVTATYADLIAPTPNPMTFASAPAAVSTTSISMTASTATDISGVEYYFTNTAGGGNDSGWQDSPTYVDTGLTPDSSYSYTVTARDKSAAQNTTSPSSALAAVTNPTLYALTVNSGSGDGNYEAAEVVNISADSPPAGEIFNGWVINSGSPVIANSNAANTTLTMPSGAAEVTATYMDNVAPTPNPMTFASAPAASGTTSITMTATTATDASGVEYYFTNTAGGGNDSGWQDSPTYVDTGLTPNTSYSYTVMARDKSGAQNATTASSAESATTDPSLYALTVNSGSGDGNYEAAEVVNITADAPPAGEIFDAWVINSGLPIIADVNSSSTTLTMPAGTATITATYVDNVAPTPDPMTLASGPDIVNATSVTMTATTASDSSGVEYYFTNTAGGGNDSGWQDSPTYVDTGLTSGNTYSYTVTARDKSTAQNATTASSAASAFLHASTNIVLNGSFESGSATPDSWNMDVDHTYATDNANYGVKSLAVSGSGSLGNTTQVVTLTPNTDYDISVWVLASGLVAGHSVFDTSDKFDASGQGQFVIDPGDADVWTEFTGSFNSGAETSVTLRMFSNAAFSGAVYYDNVRIVESTLYALTVNNGSGDGNYAAGNMIIITADAPPAGQVFDTWVINTGSPTIDNLNSSSTTVTMAAGAASVTATYVDLVAPTPDPMTFATAPTASSTTSITMTATTASDINSVEYYFTNTAGGGNDSGWQDSPTYEDTGLTPNTSYSYTVTARDKSAAQNSTAASSAQSATTDAIVYALTVNNGTGDGNYQAAQVVNITADTPAPGDVFDGWVINTGSPVIADANASTTTLTMTAGAAEITATYTTPDVTAPTPNPMTISSGPTRVDATTITMTASTATDPSGVEYYFTNTAGGGNDSGWQDSPTYVDVLLSSGNTYSYTVMSRDKSPAQNTTTASAAASLLLNSSNNIVQNGSFENGGATPDSWTMDPDHTYANTNANYGVRSIEITGTGGLGNTLQAVTLTPNTNYDISIWVEASGLTAGRAVFDTSDVFDGPGEGQFAIDPGDADVWTQFTGSFNSGAVTSITIRTFTNATFAGTVYFDDISIVESTLYTLTVNSGTGNGDYAAGNVVNITADAPPAGQVFDSWVINSGSPTIDNANASTTTLTMPAGAATVTATYIDLVAPTPDPMTFATAPTATGTTSITMTATTASDINGVEYYFTNTAGGGNDSGWQDSATYVDSGLSPNTSYSYTVTARDKSAAQNSTAASSAASATTDPLTYALTVNNGSGDGNYQAAQVVNITADAPAPGDVFNAWVINSGTPVIGDVNSASTTLTMAAGSAEITATYNTPDATAPTPDPMTFASGPAILDATSITMTATTASDPSGVEYYFTNTAGGGNDSGWQDSPTYVDVLLTTGNTYSYTVTARDKSAGQNTSAASAAATVLLSGGTNIVLNGSFEDGSTTPDSWNFNPAQTYASSDKNYGVKSLALIGTGSLGSTTQTVTLTPNTYYDISVWVEASALTAGHAVFDTSDVFDASGEGQFVITPGSADVWTQFTGRFNSGVETSLTLRMFNNATFDGSVYFDDVRVVESTLYALTVNSGTGDGNYVDGEVVNIVADAPAPGDLFDGWVINSGSPVIANANSTTTTLTMPAGTATVTATYTAADLSAPLPNPMTFANGPVKVNATSISMTASTASDPSGVEYYFTNTAGGGNDSGWQDSATYMDTGLTAGNTYSYTVTARDKSPAQNSTSASAARSLLLNADNNLVLNGSFENGSTSPDSWTMDLDHSFAGGNPYYGVRSLGIIGSGALGNTTQTITLTPNTNYDISVWVLASGLSAGHSVFDTSDKFDASGQGQFVIDPGDADVWTQFSGSFNSGAETSVTLRMFTNAAFSGAVYYDDVSIIESSLYALTVNNGSGDGNYASGNVVNISADAPSPGDVFDAWVINSGSPVIADTNAANTTLTMTAGAATITATYTTAPDLTAPLPNPMLFASAPIAIDSTSITMTAAVATDPSGVEYYFSNTAGGGNDSGWQDSPIYVDTGLTPNTTYSYTVTARDKSAAQNTTTASSVESATTDPVTYTLTISSGNGDGNYAPGSVVNITADAPPTGNIFDAWVINSGSPAIANLNEWSTTLTMPAGTVSVTATYKASSLDTIWTNIVRPIARGTADIPLVDSEVGESYRIGDGTYRSAYHYQVQMEIFLYGSRWLKRNDWFDDIIEGLRLIKQAHIHNLSDLRSNAIAGTITLDSFLTDPARSGSANKRVIVFVDNTQSPPYYYSNDSYEKKLADYIARALNEMSRDTLSPADETLFLDLMDFLVSEYLYSQATDVQAWHWVGSYDNAFERLDAKLNEPSTSQLAAIANYYTAIFNAEWSLFSIAADCNAIIQRKTLDGRYSTSEENIIEGFLDRAHTSFNQRLESDSYFNYDVGRWSDHPFYDWATRSDGAFPTDPTLPAEDADAASDTLRFRQMPRLLDALESGDTRYQTYYRSLKTRLGAQFMDHMLYYNADSVPLLSTYSDGNNGWYKLKYSAGFGLGPGSRSAALVGGQWALFGAQDDRIHSVFNAMGDVVEAIDAPRILARTQYYGRIQYPATGNILGTVDESGSGSLLDARLQLIASLTPSAVNDTVATDGSHLGYVQVNWSSASGATRYEILRGNIPNDPNPLVIGVTEATQFDDYTASLGQPYWYSVKAVNSIYASNPANEDSGYRNQTPPTVSDPVVSQGLYTDRVEIEWSTTENAVLYEVLRGSTSNDPAPVSAGTTTDTYFSDFTATAGQTYWYSIRALNGGFAAPVSNSISGYRQGGSIAFANWQDTYFAPADPERAFGADADDDGIINGIEYAIGAQPDAKEVNPIVLNINAGTLSVRFSDASRADTTLQLLESTDLVNWTPVATSIVGTNNGIDTREATYSTSNIRRFFRLEVSD